MGTDARPFSAAFLNRKGGVGKTSTVFHLAGSERFHAGPQSQASRGIYLRLHAAHVRAHANKIALASSREVMSRQAKCRDLVPGDWFRLPR